MSRRCRLCDDPKLLKATEWIDGLYGLRDEDDNDGYIRLLSVTETVTEPQNTDRLAIDRPTVVIHFVSESGIVACR